MVNMMSFLYQPLLWIYLCRKSGELDRLCTIFNQVTRNRILFCIHIMYLINVYFYSGILGFGYILCVIWYLQSRAKGILLRTGVHTRLCIMFYFFAAFFRMWLIFLFFFFVVSYLNFQQKIHVQRAFCVCTGKKIL